MDKVYVCFVVLHYNTIEDTEYFLTSVFENISIERYHIIIVDNASPNGSGKLIEEKYKEHQKVTVLLNDVNAGFAKGNNLGIAYAEKFFDPDFIVMTNSDTYLIQKDFYSQIQKEYERSHFFVLGPQIMTPRGISKTQGQCRKPYDRSQTKQMIKSMKYHLVVNYLGIAPLLSGIQKFMTSGQRAAANATNPSERRENVYLEGACLIFSKDYIHAYHGINPLTHMFFEEEILFYEMTRDRRKTVYNPSVKIFHNSHRSTDHVYNKKRNQMIYKCKNQLNSANILLNIIDTDLRQYKA